MTAEKIYFDMDGVLADFERGIRGLCHMEAPSQNGKQDEKADNLMWEAVRETGHFYDRLDLMPGAKEMFDRIFGKYGDRCEILTGIPKAKRGIVTAGEDKKNWMKRMLSDRIKVNIVYREQKPEYCKGKGCVLVDDLEKNIREWEEMGGTGILHVSAENTLAELEKLGLL